MTCSASQSLNEIGMLTIIFFCKGKRNALQRIIVVVIIIIIIIIIIIVY